MAASRSDRAPDPLGKRALFWVPSAGESEPGGGGVSAALPVGKRALYSGAPPEPDSLAMTSGNPLDERGNFTVECGRCRQVSHIGVLDLLIFQLPLGVCERLHADRREQHRRGQRRPQHRARERALGDVAQHPRHDPPAIERLAVGADRLAAPRAAGDVAARAVGEQPVGVALQPSQASKWDALETCMNNDCANACTGS